MLEIFTGRGPTRFLSFLVFPIILQRVFGFLKILLLPNTLVYRLNYYSTFYNISLTSHDVRLLVSRIELVMLWESNLILTTPSTNMHILLLCEFIKLIFHMYNFSFLEAQYYKFTLQENKKRESSYTHQNKSFFFFCQLVKI